MPFAGYKDFDECVLDQKTKGHDEDTSNKICGYLYNKLEKQATALSKSDVALTIARTLLEKAKWSKAYIDSLPDSSFLIVESGGKKDDDGKTTPRSLRHFPVRDANGKIDLPHLRNALSRIPQSKLPENLKNKAKAKAQRLLSGTAEKAASEAIDKARRMAKPKPPKGYGGGSSMDGMCKDDVSSGDLNSGGKIQPGQIDTSAKNKKKPKVVVNGITQTSEHQLSVTQIAAKKNVFKSAYPVKLYKAEPVTQDQDERYVLGVVLEPETIDAQNDLYDEATIRKTAHDYMMNHQDVGLQHKGLVNNKIKIVESYLAPATFELEGQTVKKGTWMMAAKVLDDELWTDVKNGELTGWSIGGSAIRTTEEEPPPSDSLPG